MFLFYYVVVFIPLLVVANILSWILINIYEVPKKTSLVLTILIAYIILIFLFNIKNETSNVYHIIYTITIGKEYKITLSLLLSLIITLRYYNKLDGKNG